jgi:hypothetical protein
MIAAELSETDSVGVGLNALMHRHGLELHTHKYTYMNHTIAAELSVTDSVDVGFNALMHQMVSICPLMFYFFVFL